MTFVERMTVGDAEDLHASSSRTPTGLAHASALGKPSSNVPFMMPKRVAETDPNTQISEFIGSGPFVFKTRRVEARRQGGLRQVRQVQAARRAGLGPRRRQGRQGRPRRVARDLRPAAGRSTRCIAGEIDFIEAPPHDLLPLAQGRRQHQARRLEPARQPVHLPPQPTCTSRSTTRRSARRCWYAFNQEDFLKAVIGDPSYYKVCKSMFVCGTPLASDKGMEGLLEVELQEGAASC